VVKCGHPDDVTLQQISALIPSYLTPPDVKVQQRSGQTLTYRLIARDPPRQLVRLPIALAAAVKVCPHIGHSCHHLAMWACDSGLPRAIEVMATLLTQPFARVWPISRQ